MKKITILILCSFLLSGCSTNVINTENSQETFNEEKIKNEISGEISIVEEQAKKNENNIILPINVLENGEIIDTANIKFISLKYETNTIEYFKDFIGYIDEKYIDNNGNLKDEYVLLELTLEITTQKDFSELNLADFKFQTQTETNYYFHNPQIVDKCIDFSNPHKGGIISIKANQPTTVTLGYIVYHDVLSNTNPMYLNAQFSDFGNIKGNDVLQLMFTD